MKEILKKERRKAEKSLAYSKKNVCYQCRQPGHMLIECPQSSKSAAGKKMNSINKCFKCGSTEHTSKNCHSKLQGADAYRFANCFVCGQTGHLAKACPDNPKGLYPKGRVTLDFPDPCHKVCKFAHICHNFFWKILKNELSGAKIKFFKIFIRFS